MADEVGTLVARVVADQEKFRSDMLSMEKQLQSTAARMNKSLSRVESGLGAMRQGFSTVARAAAAFGIALSVRGIVTFITSATEAADQTAKLSQQLGVSISTLQGLSLGAQLAGASSEQLNTGLTRLARTISDAARGTETQARAFRELGIGVRDSNGTLRATDEVLFAVADKFAKMEDGTKKAALAQELFGRSGAVLIPLLNQGAAGVEDMVDLTKRLGIAWSDEAARAAEHFNDNLTILKAGSQGLGATIVRELLPALSELTDQMVSFTTEGQGVSRLASGLATAFKTVADPVIRLGYGMVGLADRMAGASAALTALVTDGLGAARGVLRELETSQRGLQEEMDRTIDALWNGSTRAAGAVTRVAEAAGELDEAVDTTGTSEQAIWKQVRALEAEAATFGMSRTAVELFKLEMAGANEVQLDMARGALNLIEILKREREAIAPFSARFVGAGQEGPVPDVEPGLDEIAAMSEVARQTLGIAQQTTSALEAEYKKRSEFAWKMSQEAVTADLQGQMQILDFRYAASQQIASLANALFGENKAIQLAAIAFEKLVTIRRMKMSVDLAAWQAFASQLIPGDPTSLGRARAAYQAVKARGTASIAQTVAISVLSGLAEAAQVVRSSGAPGSYTNPLSTTNASVLGTASANAAASRPGATTIYIGSMVGWSSYVRDELISAIREATDRHDVILFGPNSAQAQMIGG